MTDSMKYGWCTHCLSGAFIQSTDPRDHARVVQVIAHEWNPIRVVVRNIDTGRKSKLSMRTVQSDYRVLSGAERRAAQVSVEETKP